MTPLEVSPPPRTNSNGGCSFRAAASSRQWRQGTPENHSAAAHINGGIQAGFIVLLDPRRLQAQASAAGEGLLLVHSSG